MLHLCGRGTRRGISRRRGSTVKRSTAVSGMVGRDCVVAAEVPGVYALECEMRLLIVTTDGHRGLFDRSILGRTIKGECEITVPMV